MSASTPPPLITTERTTLRLPAPDDAEFFLELLNDPEFIRFTGDREIRDLTGARGYVTERLLPAHATHGFTLYVVESRETHQPLGINGLVRRDYLDAPDIGFGFLARHCDQGIGHETSVAVMDYAQSTLAQHVIYGITRPDNTRSIRLLERLGLKHNRTQTLPGLDAPQLIYRTPDPNQRSLST
ncbi:MAG: GNAT family N-acetyltransferase [Opitutaceae bacterium]|jgi:[ribosomal protein S5]-alanine N-acetyltransferase|nr:GNAT family N-acetyltransferase [Opitutaceae bacterium]